MGVVRVSSGTKVRVRADHARASRLPTGRSAPRVDAVKGEAPAAVVVGRLDKVRDTAAHNAS